MKQGLSWDFLSISIINLIHLRKIVLVVHSIRISFHCIRFVNMLGYLPRLQLTTSTWAMWILNGIQQFIYYNCQQQQKHIQALTQQYNELRGKWTPNQNEWILWVPNKTKRNKGKVVIVQLSFNSPVKNNYYY